MFFTFKFNLYWLCSLHLSLIYSGYASEKPYILWRILITLTKFPTRFLKHCFLIYGSSLVPIYVTSVDSNLWNLCKLITFASVKLYCLITLISLIILISHIAQLVLIHKFYYFRQGPHIFFKYAWHNHLRCPMMGEVSLET